LRQAGEVIFGRLGSRRVLAMVSIARSGYQGSKKSGDKRSAVGDGRHSKKMEFPKPKLMLGFQAAHGRMLTQ
jgi:hypothetical protein